MLEQPTNITSERAQLAMEDLTWGIPPAGLVQYFTVGRVEEKVYLRNSLIHGKNKFLLLNADYGTGKTHLLKFIKEVALEEGYLVSNIELDAQGALRFNLMDQVFGAVLRKLEISGITKQGPWVLFDAILQKYKTDSQNPKSKMRDLSNKGNWNDSFLLNSCPLYIGLRAWIIFGLYYQGTNQPQQGIADWLTNPWKFKARKRDLMREYVTNLASYFKDSRCDREYYNFSGDCFRMDLNEYRHSWNGLSDLDILAKLAGFKGLVILVDEFERSLNDLKRGDYQEAALNNLIRFSKEAFSGFSYFAVTPDFIQRVKYMLKVKDRWDFDFKQFSQLPTFQMSPLNGPELVQLAEKIVFIHSIARQWDPYHLANLPQLYSQIEGKKSLQVASRVRTVIKDVTNFLNLAWENSVYGN